MCVQNLDDSRGLAIRITYRISLRSSSLWEPRHPLLKVVQTSIHFHTLLRDQLKHNTVARAYSLWLQLLLLTLVTSFEVKGGTRLDSARPTAATLRHQQLELHLSFTSFQPKFFCFVGRSLRRQHVVPALMTQAVTRSGIFGHPPTMRS